LFHSLKLDVPSLIQKQQTTTITTMLS